MSPNIQYRYVFKPTRNEIVLYLILATIALSIASSSQVIQVLFPEPVRQTFNDLLGENVTSLTGDVNNFRTWGTVFVVLLWAGMGGLLYGGMWFITNKVMEYKSTHYVRGSYVNMGSHSLNVSAIIVRVAAALFIPLFIAINVDLLLPLWINLFSSFVVSLDVLQAWPVGLGAIAGMAVSFYILAIALRLLAQRTRIFSVVDG